MTSRCRLFAAVVCSAVFLFAAIPAARAEMYPEATLPNMLKMLIRFGSLDINDDHIVNLFARATECELYRKYSLDDFKWHKAQAAFRKYVRENAVTFPVTVRFDTSLQLGKYDFSKKIYRFSEKTAQFNVNVFTLKIDGTNFCTNEPAAPIPQQYQMVLDKPLLLEGIPLTEKDGSALMYRMKEAGNKDLIVYARFNMRAMYMPKIETTKSEGEKVATLPEDGLGKPKQPAPSYSDTIRVDTKLDSVEFYEDEARTKLLYKVVP